MSSKKQNKPKEVTNTLTGLAEGLALTSSLTPAINGLGTAMLNNRYGLIFNDRQTLSQLYTEHGLIQTLVDMPVDDAFRKGFDMVVDEVDEEDVADVMRYMEENDFIHKISQAIKWGRLFGGGGLVIMTDQPSDQPFLINKINEYSNLDFYPADLWELNMSYYKINPTEELGEECPYKFYSMNLHKSRVLKFKGKEAPSITRPRMRGWGMTEVERVIRSFNQYLKNNNLIFELLDESKIDVFKMRNLNTNLLSPQGTSNVQARVQRANEIKNYLNALVMDVDDEYEQKQLSFGGLGEMLDQIRKGIASDLKMPVTKLFGVSSAGFNSGEDDIENYNAMVEHEVRAKATKIIVEVAKICFQKVHGFVPENIKIEFPPLRVLNAEQEENVKNAKLNRVMIALERGIISAETAQKIINKDNLLNYEIETDGAYELPEGFGFGERETTASISTSEKEAGVNIKPKQAGNI